MLTEGQQFFLVFVVLYLSECVLWVKRRAWVFLSGRRWRVNAPLRGDSGRPAFASPLPPFGWGFVTGEMAHSGYRLDTAGVREALNTFTAATRPLSRLIHGGLTPLFFLALPLTYWAYGATLPFWLLLAAAWGALAAAAWLFHRAHRQLYPEAKNERRQHTILVALVPQHALRSPGLLARPWLSAFHPLAIAAVVLEREAFTTLASRLWREAVFPSPTSTPPLPPAGPTLSPEELATFLRCQGIEPDTLLSPPNPTPGAQAYCPRCHAQFQTSATHCPDCAGLPVRPFPPSA